MKTSSSSNDLLNSLLYIVLWNNLFVLSCEEKVLYNKLSEITPGNKVTRLNIILGIFQEDSWTLDDYDSMPLYIQVFYSF